MNEPARQLPDVVPITTEAVIQMLREKVSDNDRAILKLVNSRMKLVRQLKAFKENHNIELIDPDRETWIMKDLQRANTGPLTELGVTELVIVLLMITKRECELG